MKKLLVALLLGIIMFLSSTVVNAQEVSGVSGTTTTAQVSSSFIVEPNDLSMVVISIPENLDLVLNEDATYYTNTSQVSAKGTLRGGYKLAISTSNSVTYTSNGHPDVSGAVTFGTQEWTSEQLAASETTLDSRDITVAVGEEDVTEPATYSANISFSVAVSRE